MEAHLKPLFQGDMQLELIQINANERSGVMGHCMSSEDLVERKRKCSSAGIGEKLVRFERSVELLFLYHI